MLQERIVSIIDTRDDGARDLCLCSHPRWEHVANIRECARRRCPCCKFVKGGTQVTEDDGWITENDNNAPFWQCQSCGFKDVYKSMPADRERFYSRPHAAKCPKCKSQDMTPVGF